MSQHSVGRTIMINLPAELEWFSKNLPLDPWASENFIEPSFSAGRFTQTWFLSSRQRNQVLARTGGVRRVEGYFRPDSEFIFEGNKLSGLKLFHIPGRM